VPAVQYWTDSDIPLVTLDTNVAPANQQWTPNGIGIDTLVYQGTSVSSTNITIQNADYAMSGLVYNPLSIKSVPVDIYEAWLDPSVTTAVISGGLGVDIKYLFSGVISSGLINRQGDVCIATYSLSLPIDQNAITLPRRILTTKCTVLFKGAACQYSGSVETCDRTLVTCKTLGNQANYGGFPSIPTAKT
jgi:hypothetical protein